MSTLNEAAEMLKLMEQDSGSGSSSLEQLDQEVLGTVASLAKAIKDKEELIESLEQTLKEEKKALIKMTDQDLPALLLEKELIDFKLKDGTEVSVKQTYGASIRVDDRPAAYEWLRDNGYDDIIKNQVFVFSAVAKTTWRLLSKLLRHSKVTRQSRKQRFTRRHFVPL